MSTWTAKSHELLTHQAHQLAQILLEINPDEPAPQERKYRATAAGDERRLRGIPALARGVGSAIPGTNPLQALIAKQGRISRGV